MAATIHAPPGGKSRFDFPPARRHVSGAMAKMTRKAAAEFYARLAAATPEPKTELHYSNPFTLLVAVVLSAQATDAGVNRATAKLFAVAKTPEEMLALGEERLGEMIRTIGLWRAKAKNVIALSKALIADHGGEPPRHREALETLPGVGRKTANVVVNALHGDKTIAVDTHVFRVANRTGLAPGDTVARVEAALMKATPEDFLQHAHHWLILHGRYVCKARTPECWRCVVSDLCKFPQKTAEPHRAGRKAAL
jgi:endonuclease-3